jgi:tetratricopeptide (TPR) repeat protein
LLVKKVAYILILLSCITFCFGQNTDSIKKALLHLPPLKTRDFNDTMRCYLLLSLIESTPAYEWHDLNLNLKSLAELRLHYLQKKPELAKPYKRYLAEALNNLSYQHLIEENISESEKYATEGLNMSRRIDYKRGIAYASHHLGYTFFLKGGFSKALEYYYKTLELASQTKNHALILETLNDVADVYIEQKEYKQALQYLYRILLNDRENGDKEGEAIRLCKIGEVYLEENNLLKAFDLFQKSLALRQANNMVVACVHANLAEVCRMMNDVPVAIEHNQASIGFLPECHDDKTLLTKNYNNLGNCYLLEKDYPRAIKYYSLSLNMAIELQLYKYVRSSAAGLKTAYEKSGNYSDALKMYELEVKTKDALDNQKLKEEDLKDQLRRENEKKMILANETQKETDELKAQKKRYYFILITVVLTSILVVFGLIYMQSRFKKEKEKKDLLLQVKDSEIKALQAQMNPHFIFNALNSIMEFINRSESSEAVKYLTKFSKLIRKVFELSNTRNVLITEEIELLSLYIELESLRYGNKLVYSITTHESLDADHLFIPAMIIQPFVENAILHGLQNKQKLCEEQRVPYTPSLKINLKQQDEFLKCTIEDNGVGREKAQEIKKAKMFNHVSIGMRITKNRLDLLGQNNCRMEFFDLRNEFNEAIGTKVEILIPLVYNYDKLEEETK